MVETVRAAQFPAELKITIKGAAYGLAPEDALDSKVRRGVEIAKDDSASRGELARRRRAARAKAVMLAQMLDPAAAEEFLGPCDGWLSSPPQITKDKEGREVNPVQDHLLKVGLLETYSAGNTRGARPVLGSPGRKACYAALLTFKEEIPSACAQRLVDIAMVLARALEAGSHKESGSAHAYVAGLIGQGG